MRFNLHHYLASIVTAILIVCWSLTSVYADEVLVRAKIGVLKKFDDKIDRAKTRDRLKTGDLIRIYVHPELPTNIYIIHTSGESVDLLNVASQEVSSGTVVFPSMQNYYQIDGTSPTENITIICSPRPLEQIASLADGRINAKQWEAIEKELIEKSGIEIGQNLQKAFPLAGNVRGGEVADPFFEKLVIYTGKGLLVKTYAFEIEK